MENQEKVTAGSSDGSNNGFNANEIGLTRSSVFLNAPFLNTSEFHNLLKIQHLIDFFYSYSIYLYLGVCSSKN